MNILLGGTGFIGTALSQALVERGEPVVSVSDQDGNNPAIKYLKLDLQTRRLPRSLVDQADDVFILFGQVKSDFDQEKELTLLSKVVNSFGERVRVFFLSSALVYGETRQQASEGDPCQPIGVYSQYKLAAEELLQKSLPPERLVILRLANVYGSPKNRGFVATAIKKIADPAEDTPLTINGRGLPRRDYIYIGDVVGAILAIKDKLGEPGIVNIATGKSYSLLEVVKIITKVSSRKIAYHLSGERPDEPQTVLVSNEKLRQQYGFDQFFTLEEGLRETLTRYR